MLPSRKSVGCCTMCRKVLFEVKARFPSDHPLAGEIRQIGKPFPTARRATMLLKSGRTCTVTLCEKCKPTPEMLPKLWEICVAATGQELEPERRLAIGAGKLDEVQKRMITETVREMVGDLPLTILSIEKWEDHDEFSGHTG